MLKITYEIYLNHEKWAPLFTSRQSVYGLIQCFLAVGANDAAIGVFGLSDHMKRLSADGDPLEVLARVVDFELFRPTLISAARMSARSRPAIAGRLTPIFMSRKPA